MHKRVTGILSPPLGHRVLPPEGGGGWGEYVELPLFFGADILEADMNKQYEMVTTLQRMFHPNTIGDVRRLKLEFLIFRMKRLLLARERFGLAELERVCPMHELEELKELFNRMNALPDTLEELESGFRRIIGRMEAPGLLDGCNSGINY